MKKPFWIIIILLVVTGMILTSLSHFGENESSETKTAIENNSNSQIQDKIDLEDWCIEHSVPESKCTQCNPTLIDKYKASGDWCVGHDLPESHCRLCNPEIEFPQEKKISNTDSDIDWCVEHSVPESECTQCNQTLIDKYIVSGDWCAGHGLPESHCRLCNPGIKFPQEKILRTGKLEVSGNEIEVSLFFRPNQDVCATNDALIQFASTQTADRSGITVNKVIAAPYESALDAPAEIVFDENKTSVIASSVKALVSRWLISPGDIVKKDDPIAILQSSEMAELQARLMSASAELNVQKKELERDEALVPANLISRSEYESRVALHKKAEAKYISARGILLSSGISNQDIDAILENNNVSHEFVLRAPESGIIAKRIAQLGELLEDGKALAILTDPSSLWIKAHLTEDQMNNVEIGQDLYFSSDEGALNRVKGRIIWVSPYLDKHSRTGIVRAQIVKPAHNIRVGEFGRITISEKHAVESILIPKDAVQWEGCCNVVFVRESIKRFRPRKVQLVDGPGSYYQVTQGLSQGEEIVVKGSFLLKTELKKTSIGAGCCDIEPIG
ncbi:efflux RND transporter periplasmic adaptor subunit [Candidatus Zixiibacteriota bacterium]